MLVASFIPIERQYGY